MKKLLVSLAACAAVISTAGLAACADKTQYSVTCQSGEHGYVIVADTMVKAGEKVILAAHPSAGYKLTAYLVDGEVIDGVSFVMPKKDVTVSAQFEAVTYKITYVLGDATVTGSNPETYTVESATELCAPEKEGYEICGWYRYFTEPEFEYAYWDVEDYRVTSLEGLFGNVTLYAHYYNPPHSINFEECENGNCYVENYDGETHYGDTVNLTVDPDYGYELDYVTVNGERIEGTTFTMPAGGADVAAVFKPVRYEIKYELDGGTNSPDNPDYLTVEDGSVLLEDATKDGYVFYGWYFDEALTNPVYGVFSVYDFTESYLTLYAYFEPEYGEYE